MAQGTSSFTTADAIQVKMKIGRPNRGILAPDRHHGTEQRDHRFTQRGGHVSRAAVGGNHQPAAADAGLRRTQVERLIGHRHYTRAIGKADDLPGDLALLGAAQYQHVAIEHVDDLPGQRAEMFGEKLGIGQVRDGEVGVSL